ncbi:MAG: winged helix-turn-helix domain-containing protein [Ardenticatenaceae bacterium]
MLWGTTQGVTARTIESLVGRLRRRLAEINPDKTFIRTVRGQGFRINYF